MIIEGRNSVEQILGTDQTIEKILINKEAHGDLVEAIKSSGHRYQFVDKVVLDKMSVSKNHQGFIAVVSEFEYAEIEDIVTSEENQVVLILDGVEDPHNLGNIVRTAECMGVGGIVIPKNRSVHVTETVVRVSAGATSHTKIAKVTNINQTIESLKKQGFWVYACELGGTKLSYEKFSGKVAIVMGGEDKGVSQLTKKLCDKIVTIPMFGKTNSLNVANATAMVLYEIRRQGKR